ncbi:unnamed protein product [Paramecium octaurelia]|uniref:Uncharacterized protein n=1 Tax=Paramecium octaurelia TaxID=43137 RepID=A0A8S1YQ45_PAROT|nr:unnamed protein product [Paramecium octaurelia]
MRPGFLMQQLKYKLQLSCLQSKTVIILLVSLGIIKELDLWQLKKLNQVPFGQNMLQSPKTNAINKQRAKCMTSNGGYCKQNLNLKEQIWIFLVRLMKTIQLVDLCMQLPGLIILIGLNENFQQIA